MVGMRIRTGLRPAPVSSGWTVAVGGGVAVALTMSGAGGVDWGAAGLGVTVGETWGGRLGGRGRVGAGMMLGRTRGAGVGVQVGGGTRGGVSDAGGEPAHPPNPPKNKRMTRVRPMFDRFIMLGGSMAQIVANLGPVVQLAPPTPNDIHPCSAKSRGG